MFIYETWNIHNEILFSIRKYTGTRQKTLVETSVLTSNPACLAVKMVSFNVRISLCILHILPDTTAYITIHEVQEFEIRGKRKEGEKINFKNSKRNDMISLIYLKL